MTRRIHYPLYPWILWWEMTKRCNLNCIYCSSHSSELERYDEAPERALKQIRTRKPRYIEILGGEPFLIPSITEILERLKKENDNPCIMLSTNLTQDPQKVIECLPFIDHLFVSVDAIGERNRIIRGVDGTVILDRFQTVAETNRTRMNPVQLHTASVITVKNVDGIEELIESLHEIEPAAEMVLIPVEPYDHPLSLLHEPELHTEFLNRYKKLESRYPIVMTDRFKHPLQPQKQQKEGWKLPSHRCTRQFFRVVIDSRGNEITCKPSRLLEFYFGELKKNLSVTQKLHCLLAFQRDILIDRSAPICRLPCSASEFLESIINAKNTTALPRELCMFQARFKKHELEEAAFFIRTHLNSEWSREVQELLLMHDKNDKNA